MKIQFKVTIFRACYMNRHCAIMVNINLKSLYMYLNICNFHFGWIQYINGPRVVFLSHRWGPEFGYYWMENYSFYTMICNDYEVAHVTSWSVHMADP